MINDKPKRKKVGEQWRVKVGRTWKVLWTGEMESMMKMYYQHSTNEEMCELLGVGVKVLRKKAKEMGLVKDPISVLNNRKSGLIKAWNTIRRGERHISEETRAKWREHATNFWKNLPPERLKQIRENSKEASKSEKSRLKRKLSAKRAWKNKTKEEREEWALKTTNNLRNGKSRKVC